jgi:hypothetical protein
MEVICHHGSERPRGEWISFLGRVLGWASNGCRLLLALNRSVLRGYGMGTRLDR